MVQVSAEIGKKKTTKIAVETQLSNISPLRFAASAQILLHFPCLTQSRASPSLIHFHKVVPRSLDTIFSLSILKTILSYDLHKILRYYDDNASRARRRRRQLFTVAKFSFRLSSPPREMTKREKTFHASGETKNKTNWQKKTKIRRVST